MSETFEIYWRDLNCPTKPGVFLFVGRQIRVHQSHIDVAAGDPYATFTVTNIGHEHEPRYVLTRTGGSME